MPQISTHSTTPCAALWRCYGPDVLFVLLLIVFAALVQYGRIGASIGGIELASDPAMYASIIAAGLVPEAFKGDVLLSQGTILDMYRLIHFPLIEWLTDNGKTGLGYLQLTGVHVFLHYCGFYLLGRMLLQARWKALIFTLIMGMTFWLHWGTYWGGGYLDYTPRTTFAAVYAFLLCIVLAVLQKPRWWPVVMFGAGGLVYVHAISTPAVLAGLWLGFAAAKPQQQTWGRHSLWMLFTGLCGMLLLIPYALHFFTSGFSLTADDVQVLKELVFLRFDKEFTYYWQGIWTFIVQYCTVGLFPLAAVAIWILRAWGNQDEKRVGLQLGMWCLGPILVTGLFIADNTFAAMRQVPPLQFDLIRTLRFVPFFAMCFVFVALNAVLRRAYAQGRWQRFGAAFVYFGVSIGLFIGGSCDLMRTSLGYYWNSLTPERYQEAYAKTLQRKEMLDALMHYSPEGALVFVPFEEEAIRYYAHRPLVFSWKDAGSFYGAKSITHLQQWLRMYKQISSGPTAYIELAPTTGAAFMVSNRPEDKALLAQIGKIVWENAGYVLVRL